MQNSKILDFLITIIVPVYNVDKYLKRCVNSILNQEYSNYELFLVDDGSTDKSGEICDYYAIKDSRVKVIHQTNSGVSNARNKALNIANGQYVVFVDGDDWIDGEMLKSFVDTIHEYSADLVISEYKTEIENETVLQPFDFNEGLITLSNAYQKIVNPYGFYGSVWAKVFSLSIIRNNNLFFNDNLKIGEDLLFTTQYLIHCKSVVYNRNHFYHYYERCGSALRGNINEFDYKRLDIIKVYEAILVEKAYFNTTNKKRATSIYVRECADWYCRTVENINKEYRSQLKDKVYNYLLSFLLDSTFGIKTKATTILKLLIPKVVFWSKYKR